MASVANITLWNDDDASVTGVSIRRDIPALNPIQKPIEVYTSTHAATLAYYAIQISKTRDKLMVIRCLSSAVMHIFNDTSNMTGATNVPIPLTGLDTLDADNTIDTTPITTNMAGAELLTAGDLYEYSDADGDEWAAYIAVLFLAGVKKRTDDNRAAFNSKRADAVRALTSKELRIFVPNSPFLSDTVLDVVYSAFGTMQAARAHLIKNVAMKMGRLTMGAETAFTGLFMLLENQGMGGLKIIKEAATKYIWFRTSFPELRVEFRSAQRGQEAILKAPRHERPFIKAMFGNTFVPVAQSEIGNLLGVAKNIMIRTNPTYSQFGGGTITSAQEQRIVALLASSAETPETETEEADLAAV